MAFPCRLFVWSRIALLGFAQLALTLVPALWWGPGPQGLLSRYPALAGLCRWDCGQFERIARLGYREAYWTNFFPLYPVLARGIHAATGIEMHLALLLVSNVASLGALIVIYRIFTLAAGEDAARWALALLVAYPFAFFQATGYPESLMMFFTALAILLALRRQHVWAGVALGLGVLARHLALFAGVSLVAAQIRQRGVHPRRLLLNRAILGLAAPWLFLGLYCYYQYRQFGIPLAFWTARAGWGPRAWWGVVQLLTTKAHDVDVQVMRGYLPFALVPTAGTVAFIRYRRWTELAAFAIVFMVVLWSVGMWGLGRYSASCWPAFLPLGVWLAKRPKIQALTIGVMSLFQGLFFYLFVHQFPIL